MNSNEMLGAVQRAVLSTDFTTPGGYLNPVQQDAFFLYLRHERNPFLAQARQVRMTQKRQDIDKMHLGRPITQKAVENSANTYPSSPQFGRTVRLDCEKLMMGWETTRDIIPQNIAMDKLQATIMDQMMQRHAVDMEILAVQGDTTVSGTDELSLLLPANDGWAKLSEDGHIVDAAGSGPHYDLFRDAYLAMPSHLVMDPGLRWIWNPAAKVRLASQLQNRPDSVGGDALLGNIRGPFGIGYLEASAIPRNLSVTALAAATSAVSRALVPGPYYVTSALKNLKVAIDGGAAQTIDLSTGLKNSVAKGPLMAGEIANVINTALNTAYSTNFQYAKDDGDGFLKIVSPTTGASSSVVYDGGGAPSSPAVAIFGGTTGFVTSSPGGAASAGVSKSGSFIWLANPQNFMYGVYENVRVSSFYAQATDKDQVVGYSWADFQIEETDSVVKIKNIIV